VICPTYNNDKINGRIERIILVDDKILKKDIKIYHILKIATQSMDFEIEQKLQTEKIIYNLLENNFPYLEKPILSLKKILHQNHMEDLRAKAVSKRLKTLLNYSPPSSNDFSFLNDKFIESFKKKYTFETKHQEIFEKLVTIIMLIEKGLTEAVSRTLQETQILFTKNELQTFTNLLLLKIDISPCF
jgi:hypothetical protein